MAAPRPRTRSEQRYSDRKLRSLAGGENDQDPPPHRRAGAPGPRRRSYVLADALRRTLRQAGAVPVIPGRITRKKKLTYERVVTATATLSRTPSAGSRTSAGWPLAMTSSRPTSLRPSPSPRSSSPGCERVRTLRLTSLMSWTAGSFTSTVAPRRLRPCWRGCVKGTSWRLRSQGATSGLARKLTIPNLLPRPRAIGPSGPGKLPCDRKSDNAVRLSWTSVYGSATSSSSERSERPCGAECDEPRQTTPSCEGAPHEYVRTDPSRNGRHRRCRPWWRYTRPSDADAWFQREGLRARRLRDRASARRQPRPAPRLRSAGDRCREAGRGPSRASPGTRPRRSR